MKTFKCFIVAAAVVVLAFANTSEAQRLSSGDTPLNGTGTSNGLTLNISLRGPNIQNQQPSQEFKVNGTTYLFRHAPLNELQQHYNNNPQGQQINSNVNSKDTGSYYAVHDSNSGRIGTINGQSSGPQSQIVLSDNNIQGPDYGNRLKQLEQSNRGHHHHREMPEVSTLRQQINNNPQGQQINSNVNSKDTGSYYAVHDSNSGRIGTINGQSSGPQSQIVLSDNNIQGPDYGNRLKQLEQSNRGHHHHREMPEVWTLQQQINNNPQGQQINSNVNSKDTGSYYAVHDSNSGRIGTINGQSSGPQSQIVLSDNNIQGPDYGNRLKQLEQSNRGHHHHREMPEFSRRQPYYTIAQDKHKFTYPGHNVRYWNSGSYPPQMFIIGDGISGDNVRFNQDTYSSRERHGNPSDQKHSPKCVFRSESDDQLENISNGGNSASPPYSQQHTYGNGDRAPLTIPQTAPNTETLSEVNNAAMVPNAQAPSNRGYVENTPSVNKGGSVQMATSQNGEKITGSGDRRTTPVSPVDSEQPDDNRNSLANQNVWNRQEQQTYGGLNGRSHTYNTGNSYVPTVDKHNTPAVGEGYTPVYGINTQSSAKLNEVPQTAGINNAAMVPNAQAPSNRGYVENTPSVNKGGSVQRATSQNGEKITGSGDRRTTPVSPVDSEQPDDNRNSLANQNVWNRQEQQTYGGLNGRSHTYNTGNSYVPTVDKHNTPAVGEGYTPVYGINTQSSAKLNEVPQTAGINNAAMVPNAQAPSNRGYVENTPSVNKGGSVKTATSQNGEKITGSGDRRTTPVSPVDSEQPDDNRNSLANQNVWNRQEQQTYGGLNGMSHTDNTGNSYVPTVDKHNTPAVGEGYTQVYVINTQSSAKLNEVPQTAGINNAAMVPNAQAPSNRGYVENTPSVNKGGSVKTATSQNGEKITGSGDRRTTPVSPVDSEQPDDNRNSLANQNVWNRQEQQTYGGLNGRSHTYNTGNSYVPTVDKHNTPAVGEGYTPVYGINTQSSAKLNEVPQTAGINNAAMVPNAQAPSNRGYVENTPSVNKGGSVKTATSQNGEKITGSGDRRTTPVSPVDSEQPDDNRNSLANQNVWNRQEQQTYGGLNGRSHTDNTGNSYVPTVDKHNTPAVGEGYTPVYGSNTQSSAKLNEVPQTAGINNAAMVPNAQAPSNRGYVENTPSVNKGGSVPTATSQNGEKITGSGDRRTTPVSPVDSEQPDDNRNSLANQNVWNRQEQQTYGGLNGRSHTDNTGNSYVPTVDKHNTPAVGEGYTPVYGSNTQSSAKLNEVPQTAGINNAAMVPNAQAPSNRGYGNPRQQTPEQPIPDQSQTWNVVNELGAQSPVNSAGINSYAPPPDSFMIPYNSYFDDGLGFQQLFNNRGSNQIASNLYGPQNNLLYGQSGNNIHQLGSTFYQSSSNTATAQSSQIHNESSTQDLSIQSLGQEANIQNVRRQASSSDAKSTQSAEAYNQTSMTGNYANGRNSYENLSSSKTSSARSSGSNSESSNQNLLFQSAGPTENTAQYVKKQEFSSAANSTQSSDSNNQTSSKLLISNGNYPYVGGARNPSIIYPARNYDSSMQRFSASNDKSAQSSQNHTESLNTKIIYGNEKRPGVNYINNNGVIALNASGTPVPSPIGSGSSPQSNNPGNGNVYNLENSGQQIPAVPLSPSTTGSAPSKQSNTAANRNINNLGNLDQQTASNANTSNGEHSTHLNPVGNRNAEGLGNGQQTAPSAAHNQTTIGNNRNITNPGNQRNTVVTRTTPKVLVHSTTHRVSSTRPTERPHSVNGRQPGASSENQQRNSNGGQNPNFLRAIDNYVHNGINRLEDALVGNSRSGQGSFPSVRTSIGINSNGENRRNQWMGNLG